MLTKAHASTKKLDSLPYVKHVLFTRLKPRTHAPPQP